MVSGGIGTPNSKLLHWYRHDRKNHSSLVIPMDTAQMVKWTTILEIMGAVDCSEEELVSAIANYHYH